MKRAFRTLIVAPLMLAGPLAGSASAHEFVVSKTGKGKIEAVAPQIFRTSAVTVECLKASASVEFATLKSEVLDVAKLPYSGCSAAGGVASATGSYDFNANGPITLTKAVTIQLEEAAECSIVLGTKGTSHREMLSYKNNAGKVSIGVDVTGLTYTSSGGVCGAGGTNGSYEGTLQVSLEGGTVEWK